MTKQELLNIGSGDQILTSKDLDNLSLKNIEIETIDFNKDTKPDILWDLNKYPYPIKSNRYDYVFCHHILEHLSNLVRTMEELHRVSKNNAIIFIHVPFYLASGAWGNPTHVRGFNISTMDNFEGNSADRYTKKTFKILSKRYSYLHHETYSRKGRAINKLLNPLINFSPAFYEKLLVHYIGAADEIIYVLRVVK